MGSQRRQAELLANTFDIDLEKAYQLGKLIDDVEKGDDISNALYSIENGKVDDGLKELYSIISKMAGAAVRLQQAIRAIQEEKGGDNLEHQG